MPTATKKKKTKNEEDQKLPSLQEGEVRTIRSMELLRKKTKPPAPHTESSLLSAMENAGRFVEDEALKEQMKDSGLGTPATRAAIIERLLTVGYLTRKGKTLLPTEKGRKLIEVVPQEMRSPQTTGKWEKGLSSIAKGKMTEERFMASIRRYVQFLIQDADRADGRMLSSLRSRCAENAAKQMPLGNALSADGIFWKIQNPFIAQDGKAAANFRSGRTA